jgi:hypothetical protein
MNWKVPRMWEDADVWIIGGGPSIPRQFGIPDKLIQSVIDGSSPPSVYSPYMSFLHDKHVIGINVAYMLGNWVDMVFFGDGNFFLKHKEGLSKYSGLRVSCNPQTSKVDWVKYLTRDPKHPKGISSNPSTVSWNCNSGAAAISVAANAGAKRIILLGFDMKLSNTNNQHWHDVYKRGVIVGKRMNKLPFGRHLIGFADIAKDAKSRGIEIINACPDSAIEQFRRVSVNELCKTLV